MLRQSSIEPPNGGGRVSHGQGPPPYHAASPQFQRMETDTDRFEGKTRLSEKWKVFLGDARLTFNRLAPILTELDHCSTSRQRPLVLRLRARCAVGPLHYAAVISASG